jgi:hypothetical protein
MSEKIIKISVDTNGVAKIEAEGFKGGGCKDATKLYESLYDTPISATDKPELHEGASCPVHEVRI